MVPYLTIPSIPTSADVLTISPVRSLLSIPSQGGGGYDFSVFGDDAPFLWDEWEAKVTTTTLSTTNEFMSWTGSASSRPIVMEPVLHPINRARLINGQQFNVNGVTNPSFGRIMMLSTNSFGGNPSNSKVAFWVIETNFQSATAVTSIIGYSTSPTDRSYIQLDSTKNFLLGRYEQFNPGVKSVLALSSLGPLSGGMNTYIFEIRDRQDTGFGTFLVNGIKDNYDITGLYSSPNLWEIGHDRPNNVFLNFNGLNMNVKGCLFLRHPNNVGYIPLSTIGKFRQYLANKYSVSTYQLSTTI